MSVPDLQDALDRLQQKDVGSAIEVLEEKVTILPAHLAAHVLLARAYEARQQWERALQAWQSVRLLLPNSPVAEEGIERVLRRLSDWKHEHPVALSPTAPSEGPESAPESDAETDDADPSPDTLARLRRRAEQEARRGGARSGLADDAPAPSTPEEHLRQFEEEEADTDLDRLIDELESARIEPDPNPEDVPAPDLEDDIEDVVSETLAEIYVSQNEYREAARVYSKLASQEPAHAEEYRQKAAEMREKADGEDDS